MNEREHAHELIDRLPEMQLLALVGLLETIIDPVATALRKAPLDDEPETEDEKRAVPKAAIGSPAAAAMGFRMKKPCAGFARRVKQTVERFAAPASATGNHHRSCSHRSA